MYGFKCSVSAILEEKKESKETSILDPLGLVPSKADPVLDFYFLYFTIMCTEGGGLPVCRYLWRTENPCGGGRVTSGCKLPDKGAEN